MFGFHGHVVEERGDEGVLLNCLSIYMHNCSKSVKLLIKGVSFSNIATRTGHSNNLCV